MDNAWDEMRSTATGAVIVLVVGGSNDDEDREGIGG
jgi:hypothetical protein